MKERRRGIWLGRWLVVGIFIITGINLALAYAWSKLVRIEVWHATEQSQYVLNQLSLEIALLEIILTGAGIFAAFLGLAGYSQLKETSEEVAKRVANAHMKRFFAELRSKKIGEGMDTITNTVVPSGDEIDTEELQDDLIEDDDTENPPEGERL